MQSFYNKKEESEKEGFSIVGFCESINIKEIVSI
jgi:hypothetical protein